MIIYAKYIGHSSSLGYVRGNNYWLSLDMNKIIPVDRVAKEKPCQYGSIESFLRNWEIQDCTFKTLVKDEEVKQTTKKKIKNS